MYVILNVKQTQILSMYKLKTFKNANQVIALGIQAKVYIYFTNTVLHYDVQPLSKTYEISN